MKVHTIHVFISHSWMYHHHYNTLSKWIFGTEWRDAGGVPIMFKNFSVPRDNPIIGARTDRQLKEAIFNQIKRCHAIVIPTGMYASYSKWISKEIEGSRNYNKPILAVDPRGQERKSSVVRDAAYREVKWNSRSVVDGIFKCFQNAR